MQVHTQKKKRIIYFIECGLKITRVKGRQRKFEENNGPFKVLCIFKDKTLFNPELVKKRLNKRKALKQRRQPLLRKTILMKMFPSKTMFPQYLKE